LDFADLKIFDTVETRIAIMKVIRKLRPNVVLTLWYD